MPTAYFVDMTFKREKRIVNIYKVCHAYLFKIEKILLITLKATVKH